MTHRQTSQFDLVSTRAETPDDLGPLGWFVDSKATLKEGQGSHPAAAQASEEAMMAILKNTSMTMYDSLFFDKEDFIQSMVESVRKASGLTQEEFERDWIVDEFPIEIQTEVLDFNTTSYEFKYRQQFKIRRRTDEERQTAIENKEKIDVDPNNS